MTFTSILFPHHPPGKALDPLAMPACFPDLNLDQLVDDITAGRQGYNLKPFFYAPLADIAAIHDRHAIFRDLEDPSLQEGIQTFAYAMITMRRYLALAAGLEFKRHFQGWFLEAALVYCAAVGGLAAAIQAAGLKSPGLTAFREYLLSYAASPGFTTLAHAAQECKAALAGVRYCVAIKDSTVRVRKYAGETDYSAEVERTFARFKQGAAKDYRVQLLCDAGMTQVEAQILDLVAKLYPEPFARLERFCTQWRDFSDPTLVTFDREIQFYLAYLEFIAALQRRGLQFCYPELSITDKTVYDHDGFDLALAHKCLYADAPLVTNSFGLHGPERILVVTGPNQGGKTTFARAFGQIHYLAGLGCPVPGREARLFLCDRILTHFEQEEDIHNLRGKLKDDLVRIEASLAQATPNSLIILNEIFTSTSLQDAIFLSTKIFERIMALDLLCVCVTFIDELAGLSEKTVSLVSTVEPDNPARRTFRIVRRTADGLAYALSIAEKYRLTYTHLQERIKP